MRHWLYSTVAMMVDAGAGAPLLLLLFNGDPMDVTFAHESPHVDAIMSCVYPAQATGEALYRVVTMSGPHSVPAARLPNTWPAMLHQVYAAAVADFLIILCYIRFDKKQTTKCQVMFEFRMPYSYLFCECCSRCGFQPHDCIIVCSVE